MKNSISWVFPIHPLYSQNGKRISYNSIYSSNHWGIRNSIVTSIKNYLDNHISHTKYKGAFPFKTKLNIYLPMNWNSCRLDKSTGRIRWNKDYKYQIWDVSNYAYVWEKAIIDKIIEYSDIEDDDVRHLTGTSNELIIIDDINKRRLEFILEW
jgi:hypothetical protein